MVSGLLMSFATRRFRRELQPRDGFILVGMTWLVLPAFGALSLSVNVWLCFMMWVGGLGIIVLAVAILPLLGVGGSQLYKAESAGPMKDQKLTPRIADTARVI